MSSLRPVPTFATGFARNASQALFPGLWNRLVWLGAPGLGVQGNILFDFSGFKNNGALINMTNANWVPGKDTWALDLVSASNNYINLGQPAELDFTPQTDAFSICGTFDTRGSTDHQTIFSKAPLTVASRQYNLALINNEQGFFFELGGTQTIFANVVPDFSNSRHHIALTVPAASSGAKLYFDTVELTPTSGSGGIGTVTNAIDVVIGREDGVAGVGRRFFNGLLDVIIYNRVLLFQEIALLAAIPYAPLILKEDAVAFLAAEIAPEILDLFNPQLKSLKQNYQLESEKQEYQIKSLKEKGQIKWLQ